jgi:hypothetical protein
MPDRSLNDRWWHDQCVVRFVSDNTVNFDYEKYAMGFKENLTKLIKEVNVKEAQYCYQKVVIKK